MEGGRGNMTTNPTFERPANTYANMHAHEQPYDHGDGGVYHATPYQGSIHGGSVYGGLASPMPRGGAAHSSPQMASTRL